MGLVGKFADFFTSGAVGTIAKTIEKYLPPSMSDKEKADLQMAVTAAERDHERQIMTLANEAEAEYNQRIKDMEGTAADLKVIPIIGPLLILARGAQRPVWGLATLLIDYQVLSKAWDLSADEQLKALLFAINILVLGFLFGERAVKNVMPLLAEYFGKRAK